MESIITILTDPAFIGAVCSIASAIGGSFFTFLKLKNTNKKELEIDDRKQVINDRTQLSKEQYQLIAELKDMIQEQRDMMIENKDEIESLRDEIRQLQAVNMNLTIENRILQSKINELGIKLDSRFENKGEN